MAGVAGWATLQQHVSMNDKVKLEKIFLRNKLYIEEEKKDKKKKRLPVLQRRTKKEAYTEYVYRIPLGLSFVHFLKKKTHLQDGLNNKHTYENFTLENLKRIKRIDVNKDIKKQLLRLFLEKETNKKTIEMEYDGMLKIKVFDKDLPEYVPFDKSYLDNCSGYKIPIGMDKETRKMIYHDFDTYQQMITSGMTRYGKSVWLKLLISTIAHHNEDNVEFYLVDLKGGLTFARFKDLKCVKAVADSPETAYEVLTQVHTDMKQTMKDYQQKGFENIKEAGTKKRKFIIIDEAGELSSESTSDKELKKTLKECEKVMSEISRIGSGIGFYQVLCTQYPTADIINRQSKANTSAVLTFRLKTEMQSRVVLDESGAEKLPEIKGRAIYWTDNKHIVQTPYISNEQIDSIIKALKKKETKKKSNKSEINAKDGENVEKQVEKNSARGKHSLIIE